MRLYVVRHGSAKSKDEDPERNLSDDGIQEVSKIAAFLKPLDLKVDTIYHSGKARARGTAEILAKAVKSSNGVKQREGLNPNDDPRKFSKEIIDLGEDVMIAGHLPFVARLVSRLVTGDNDNVLIDFPPGGLLCLERTGEKQWVIKWMVRPENFF